MLDVRQGTSKYMIRTVLEALEISSPTGGKIYNIQPILDTRVPILKLMHNLSQVQMDLSFENFMSLQNTKLILLYMELDPRVRPVLVFVRWWAEFHELSGSFLIKNYALALMVITCLAHTEVVPTVKELQSLSEPNPQFIIDGWNTGFTSDMTLINGFYPSKYPPVVGSEGTDFIELIYKFFYLYSTLDYEKHVICPFLGGTVPTSFFERGNTDKLPDSMLAYKVWTAQNEREFHFRINSPLKLQDPFDLGFNVCGITPAGTLASFKNRCFEMVETLNGFKAQNMTPSILDLFCKSPSRLYIPNSNGRA